MFPRACAAQLHALRDAAAIAYVLNRTLVLPHFDCLCDRSELVDYIPFCVFPGAPCVLRSASPVPTRHQNLSATAFAPAEFQALEIQNANARAASLRAGHACPFPESAQPTSCSTSTSCST